MTQLIRSLQGELLPIRAEGRGGEKCRKICSAIISDPAQLLACSGAEMLTMRNRMRAKSLNYQELATDLKSLEG